LGILFNTAVQIRNSRVDLQNFGNQKMQNPKNLGSSDNQEGAVNPTKDPSFGGHNYETPEPVDQFEEDMEFLKEADTMDAFVSMVHPD